MAIDYVSEKGRERLFRHMAESDRCIRSFRSVRERIIAAYEGDQYGGDDSNKVTFKVIANTMLQLADVYVHLLASTRPRINVKTKQPELKPFAMKFTQATNLLLEDIHFEETLRQVVLEAFFGLGIVKICMGDSGQGFMQDDVWYDPGRPYCECVGLDDFIYDTQASSWNKMLFAADRYRTCRDYLEQDDRVDQKVLKEIPLDQRSRHSGDESHDQYVAGHTDDDHLHSNEAADMIELIDVWLPTEGKIVTWPFRGTDLKKTGYGKPLMVMDWEGPEEGPYERLTFHDVPDNIMPVPPAWTIEHLNRTTNLLLMKLINQGSREKINTFYNPSAIDAAKHLKEAKDGDFLKINGERPIQDVIQQYTTGGASPNGQALHLNLKNIMDAAAGNLSAMAGLGPQADTATQDSLIHASVSKREANLQKTTTRFVEKVTKRLASLMWSDAVNAYPAFDSYPELGLDFDQSLQPGQREGSFFDYNFEVEPYSMVYESPSQRAQKTLGLIQQVFIPLLPLVQQQGGSIDFQRLTEMLARDLNDDDLRDIIVFDGGMDSPEDMIGASDKHGGTKPPGNKTYNHVNSSKPRPQQAQDQDMISSLLKSGGEQMPVG